MILSYLSSFATFHAFAAGFAIGTYIGFLIEENLSVGMVVVRIVTNESANELTENLKAENYRITRLEGIWPREPVTVLLTLEERHELPQLIGILNEPVTLMYSIPLKLSGLRTRESSGKESMVF